MADASASGAYQPAHVGRDYACTGCQSDLADGRLRVVGERLDRAVEGLQEVLDQPLIGAERQAAIKITMLHAKKAQHALDVALARLTPHAKETT